MLVIEPTKGQFIERWSDINWTKVERTVKRLQGRIFRAARAGKLGKLKSLQRLLARSSCAKLLAIRRVSQESRGKNTPGVDGGTCSTPEDRLALFQEPDTLQTHRPLPVKRIFIPKKNGKKRPLGIPAIKDRMLQTVVRFALEPEWESRFEFNSFGFGPGRGTMDAICAIHAALRRKGCSTWILDADIKGCFDNISHSDLLKRLSVFTQVIRRWLKAGAIEMGTYRATETGTPQGGPLSPLLMNIALDGMERLFGCENKYGKRVPASVKRGPNKGITLVRYADDAIVIAPTKERIETYVLPRLKSFLAKRGLELSESKTRIVHRDEGFDFLGCTFLKQGGKLLVKPSKENIKAHLQQVKAYLSSHKQTRTARVIQELNPVLRGWTYYYRYVNAKQIFYYCEHKVWKMLWQWACRRHKRKGKGWVRRRYFGRHKGKAWQFMDNGAILFNPGSVPVIRFTKVNGKASPMNPDEQAYWIMRRKDRLDRRGYIGKYNFWLRKQSYRCALCNRRFNGEDPIDKHHLIPKSKGGTDDSYNIVIVHRWCHKAFHAREAARA